MRPTKLIMRPTKLTKSKDTNRYSTTRQENLHVGSHLW